MLGARLLELESTCYRSNRFETRVLCAPVVAIPTVSINLPIVHMRPRMIDPRLFVERAGVDLTDDTIDRRSHR